MPRRADRYDLAKAVPLGQQAAPPRHAVRNRRVAIVPVAVPDPSPNPDAGPGQRIVAAVNRRVDILEYERSHGRISNEAYIEGRIVQALFERAGLTGGAAWNAGSRIDAEVAKEIALNRRVDTAKAIAAKMAALRHLLGRRDTRILREILGDNRSYAEVTATLDVKENAEAGGANWSPLGTGGMVRAGPGKVRERRIGAIAARFREALETLAAEGRRR